ncbi:MAG: hypothetical protein IK013_06755 [Bacteroidales bacterium]|nr:hypothetical protein [Bacteroidales bacterium]
MSHPDIYVAIPAMDERQALPLTLQDLSIQEDAGQFHVFVCVNQPESYWQSPEKVAVCQHNAQLLDYLQSLQMPNLHVIDKSSKGNGWDDKRSGVGWARKILFNKILSVAAGEDIIVSLDADTRISSHYLASVRHTFARRPDIPALAVPYYHPLAGDEPTDRAILRYEFYMRNYAINLLRIGSPYGFTALGSAIAMRAGALRKIGGITPLKSGEDFYLMQKFRKMAPIGLYNEESVFPAARPSDRVDFGTGPAIIKGQHGDWSAYPIYHHSLFDAIEETYHRIPELYAHQINTDFLTFLQNSNKTSIPDTPDIWQSIRQNVKDLPHFEQAFHEKADGLRILQFLRKKQMENPMRDEEALFDNLTYLLPNNIPDWYSRSFSFENYSVEQLDTLRRMLWKMEMEIRKEIG